MYSSMKAKALILLLVFSFALFALPEIGRVKAENSRIYIRADGRVEGTDKIEREGDVYTLTGDIGADDWSYGIVIEKDNIVVDGAGHLLKGHGDFGLFQSKPIITGITLDGRSNVTIKNLRIWGFNSVFEGNFSNSKIVGNNITGNAEGICLEGSYNNTISDNNITNNGGDGILLDYCFNSTFCENRISDSYYGIDFHYKSCNNTVSGNIITEASSGIRIEFYSKYNVIIGNNISNNHNGISIVTSNNIVTGNIMTNNVNGVSISTSNNSISKNNITNNEKGVKLYDASNNMFYHNNVIDNAIQVYDRGVDSEFVAPSVNQWDNGIDGNYWSDYNGTDSDGNGIGDTPYTVYENNTDRYPLMHPVALDIMSPSISIISPQNATYTTGNVSLNFTVNEETSWMGYSLDGQTNLTTTETTLNLHELSDGTHSLTVYATDTAGNSAASETISFTIVKDDVITTLTTTVMIIVAVAGAAITIYFTKSKKKPQ
jgi:parallel beta-helix repeat protein